MIGNTFAPSRFRHKNLVVINTVLLIRPIRLVADRLSLRITIETLLGTHREVAPRIQA